VQVSGVQPASIARGRAAPPPDAVDFALTLFSFLRARRHDRRPRLGGPGARAAADHLRSSLTRVQLGSSASSKARGAARAEAMSMCHLK
jgi:hypothetical protein